MNEPTPEQLDKLPKWVKEHISALEKSRDTWKQSALRFAKEQPESPIFIETFGDEPRQYIPANRLTIKHAGVEMVLYLTRPDDGQRFYGIEITYNEIEKFVFRGSVGIMPTGPASITLVHKDNMR